MTEISAPAISSNARQRERLLYLLALTTFIVFFQAYMVAPIIPLLSGKLGASEEMTGLIVPAYLIPYGVSTLAYGLVADRIGIHRVLFASLAAFSLLTLLTATAHTVEQLTFFRVLTGLGASGIVPLALTLVGRLYPYEQRGRALGWLFGAMAGGMAFGSPFGAMFASVVGWQGLFVSVGIAGMMLFVVVYPSRLFISRVVQPTRSPLHDIATGYKAILGSPRGARTYLYVLLNAIFHSGVFTWLGLYLEREHELSSASIGLALLGYGIPGFLLGPFIGRLADRFGRANLIPTGLFLGAIAATGLALHPPAIVIPIIALVLSLGYDMTQPLFGGIITAVGGQRAGQAMGLNVFTLFLGLGLGSLAFSSLIEIGFARAYGLFAAFELILALLAFTLFRAEKPPRATDQKGSGME